MLKNKKGFTLVEILIVVAIIGILSSVALVGLGPLQKKGRDTRRLADMRSLQSALEIYFNNHSAYPTGSADGNIGSLKTAIMTTDKIVKAFPVDPLSGRDYHYWTNADGTSYVLAADLEESTNPALNTGLDEATANGIVAGTSCKSAANPARYCVTL